MGKTKMRLSQCRKSKKVLLKAVRLRRLELLCNTNEIKKSKDEPSSNPATSSNQFLGENCDQVSNQEVSDKSGYTPPMTSHSITNETEDIITDCYLSDVEDSEHEFYNKSSASFNNSDQEDSDQELLYEVEHSGIKETDKKIIITGRRIVEMSYFFNQLQQIKHEGFGCSFSDLRFISEKIEGLRSIFTFKCSICNITERIRTENLDDGTPQDTINISAVAGSVATGIGYSQLSELLAALDIPLNAKSKIVLQEIDKNRFKSAWLPQ
ncbi:hypothetical protein RN001_000396 [Aquatica leii]|uniref:Mutator-like transposase domain-containing protein n=1 Tax=Aquatica leii TaxID=1421715 RepID=A0AAN7P9W2_9COLE|nr:hypothetical protein RN001_000396 [Aquatica leii]